MYKLQKSTETLQIYQIYCGEKYIKTIKTLNYNTKYAIITHNIILYVHDMLTYKAIVRNIALFM